MEVQDYWSKLQELRTGIKAAQDLQALGHKMVTKSSELESRLQDERRNLKTTFFSNATQDQLNELTREASRHKPPEGVIET